MGVEQTAVSKLEHRSDMYLSTVYGYNKALSGELKLGASFPEGDIPFRCNRSSRRLIVHRPVL